MGPEGPHWVLDVDKRGITNPNGKIVLDGLQSL